MATSALPFSPGDILRTQPKPGYWGCAVVLTATGRTTEFHPRFHVGITPVIFKHEYSQEEIDLRELTLLRISSSVRIAPGTYVERAEQICIGIYTARSRSEIQVLGRTDPALLYPTPLTFEVGDGTNGTFPLCGPLSKAVGWEAVVAWRRSNDTESFEREAAEARERFESMETSRLAKQRLAKSVKRGDA